ncbi:MAG: pro-sigmaK processing inhibitor BofA family protein [Oscillospiraceae bacterium]|nr:pro-sigmaK processing inhibitor BofA family protein [Oscillospiraceae bacterium]
MDTITTLLLLGGVVISIYVVIRILAAPIKWIFKFLLNALMGFLLLFLANFVSGFFDFAIPVNLITCLISGVFGIPGVIFLVVVELLFL